MGYTTEFWGKMEFNKPLTQDLIDYVNKFSETEEKEKNKKN